MAMVSTSAAVVLICIGGALDYNLCAPAKTMPKFEITNYFLALGTFLFAYGGHSAFPTIQVLTLLIPNISSCCFSMT